MWQLGNARQEMRQTKVTIIVEKQPSGQWIATSPDFSGFMVSERELAEVWRQIPIVMEALRKAAEAY